MGEIEKWEDKVSEIYSEIAVLTDKMEFYDSEIRSLEQELQEAEMMLEAANYVKEGRE